LAAVKQFQLTLEKENKMKKLKRVARRKSSLPETAGLSSVNFLHDLQIKKGHKFSLIDAHKSVGAKAGDVVTVTSISKEMDGWYFDYENIRVTNGKYSWRVSREDLGA
jgi:hypothetical protein